jgi:hypothetical protein
VGNPFFPRDLMLRLARRSGSWAARRSAPCGRPAKSFIVSTARVDDEFAAYPRADRNWPRLCYAQQKTHIHISAGKGYYGRLAEQNWSVPIYAQMIKTLQPPQQ